MTPSNPDIALRAFESFNSGDWEGATRGLGPDFVWVNDAETSRMTGTALEARGPDAVREFWHSFFSQWDEWRMEPGEPVEEPPGLVTIPVTFTARGSGSGVPIVFEFIQVWEIEDGRPVRITNKRGSDAALS